MVARVISKHYDATEKLASMGLTVEMLQEAAFSGKMGRARSTPFHPKWYAGNVMYSDALATLGMMTTRSGYRREDPSGHPLVVNRERKIALSVALSDFNTGNGDPSRPPSTRPARGIRTEEALEENQWLLFPEMHEDGGPRHDLAGYEFWWLLMHPDETGNELRLELSRGTRLNKERSIASWSERVMLPSQPLDEGGIPEVGNPDEDGPLGGEFDVEVRKLG